LPLSLLLLLLLLLQALPHPSALLPSAANMHGLLHKAKQQHSRFTEQHKAKAALQLCAAVPAG
jgi:hypothetical protein